MSRLNECDSTPNTNRDSISVNSSYNSENDEKSVTVTARNASADELMQILKLSGLTPEDEQKAEIAPVPQPAVTGLSAVVVGESIDNEEPNCPKCGGKIDWTARGMAIHSYAYGKTKGENNEWLNDLERFCPRCVAAKKKLVGEASENDVDENDPICADCGSPREVGIHRGADEEKRCADCYKYHHEEDYRQEDSPFALDREPDDFEEYNRNEMADYMNENQELDELGKEIANQGGWEEFHQKKGNGTMFQYHKDRRLALKKKYDDMKNGNIKEGIIWDEGMKPCKNCGQPRDEGVNTEADSRGICSGCHDYITGEARHIFPANAYPKLCELCHENETSEGSKFCSACASGEDMFNEAVDMPPAIVRPAIDQRPAMKFPLKVTAKNIGTVKPALEKPKVQAPLPVKGDVQGWGMAPVYTGYKWSYDNPEDDPNNKKVKESRLNESDGYYIVGQIKVGGEAKTRFIHIDLADKDTYEYVKTVAEATIFADLGEAKEIAVKIKNIPQKYRAIYNIAVKPMLAGPQLVNKSVNRVEETNMNEALTPKRENTGLNGAPRTWQNEPNEQIAGWRALVQDSDGLSQPHDMFNPVKGSDNILTVAANKKEEKLHEDAEVNAIAEKLHKKFSSLKEDYCISCDKRIKSGSDIDQCPSCYKKDHPKEGDSKKKVSETRVAATVAKRKEDHPEEYCKTKKCLYRTKEDYCPKHKPTNFRHGTRETHEAEPKQVNENSWTSKKCKKCNKVMSTREVEQPEPKGNPYCSACKKKRSDKKKVDESAWEEKGPKCECGHSTNIHTGHGCMFGAGIGKKCSCKKFAKKAKVTEHISTSSEVMGRFLQSRGFKLGTNSPHYSHWSNNEFGVSFYPNPKPSRVIPDTKFEIYSAHTGTKPNCIAHGVGPTQLKREINKIMPSDVAAVHEGFGDKLADKVSDYVFRSSHYKKDANSKIVPKIGKNQPNDKFVVKVTGPDLGWGRAKYYSAGPNKENSLTFYDDAYRFDNENEANEFALKLKANYDRRGEERKLQVEPVFESKERVAASQAKESQMKPAEVTEGLSKSTAKKLQTALDNLEKRVKKLGAPPSAKTKITQSLERFEEKMEAMKAALKARDGEDAEDEDEEESMGEEESPKTEKSEESDEPKSEKNPFEKKDESDDDEESEEESEEEESDEEETDEEESEESASPKSEKKEEKSSDGGSEGKGVKDIGKGIYESEVERMKRFRNIIEGIPMSKAIDQQTYDERHAYSEGERAGRLDFGLGTKSEYTFNIGEHEGSYYLQQYSQGYRAGWRQALRKSKEENYGKNA